MTKKHFTAIAACFKREVERAKGDETAIAHLENLALDLCVDFFNANRSFDKPRFLRACGFDD